MSQTYSISTQVFNDRHTNCYKRIFTIDRFPEGPLQNLVRRMFSPKLSHFQDFSACPERNPCILAIHHPTDPHRLINVEEQPILLTFLIQNNYTIDTNITKLMMKNPVQPIDNLMFIITY
tara:strand:- start:275 stop:634 length:360 start_codon:yes stop_codon:yes gene_type:complete